VVVVSGVVPTEGVAGAVVAAGAGAATGVVLGYMYFE
jgi:hypothetical protein